MPSVRILAGERRRHRRHRLSGEGVLFVYPGPFASLEVTDISMSGLGFLYSTWKQCNSKNRVITFFGGHDLLLEKISVQIISDILHDGPEGPAVHGTELRRCGTQFLTLSQKEEGDLERYLASRFSPRK
jgi:hypothetical protein